MSSINISLKKEAYDFLVGLKTKEKSFSEIILEFKKNEKYEKGSKEAVLQFAGVLKNKGIDWKEKEKAMVKFRDSFNTRINETRKIMQRPKK